MRGRQCVTPACTAIDGAVTGRADTGPVPEGPSIVILKEEAAGFAGRRVVSVRGNSREPIQRMAGQRVRALRSWGKHFLVEFDGFSLRVHFMLFGSYRINARKDTPPRLGLDFDDGDELNFYACSVKFIDAPLDEVYDWSVDVMNDAWDPALARRNRARTVPAWIGWTGLVSGAVVAAAASAIGLGTLVGKGAVAPAVVGLAGLALSSLVAGGWWWRPRRPHLEVGRRFLLEHLAGGLLLAVTLWLLASVLQGRIRAVSIGVWQFPLFPFDAEALLYFVGVLLAQVAQ